MLVLDNNLLSSLSKSAFDGLNNLQVTNPSYKHTKKQELLEILASESWIMLPKWFVRNKLKHMHQFLKQELYLRNNELELLPTDVFITLPKLHDLGLSGNRLKTVDGNTFSLVPGKIPSHLAFP